MQRTNRRRARGQGMTEYIIIVALIAVAAIAVYRAFGDVVRGQTSIAAVALSGGESFDGRGLVGESRQRASDAAESRTLGDFEQ
jgi:type IV pilus assembly protein PilA